jgi:hypothetical protein
VNVEAMGGTMTEVDGVGMTIGGIELNPAPRNSCVLSCTRKIGFIVVFLCMYIVSYYCTVGITTTLIEEAPETFCKA